MAVKKVDHLCPIRLAERFPSKALGPRKKCTTLKVPKGGLKLQRSFSRQPLQIGLVGGQSGPAQLLLLAHPPSRTPGSGLH